MIPAIWLDIVPDAPAKGSAGGGTTTGGGWAESISGVTGGSTVPGGGAIMPALLKDLLSSSSLSDFGGW
jgi:hypothetical protein